jgi:UDP-N-acetylglucosamine--N-acetylmuramyl-(pentapeptide) pyrophosphoryl-undecaprenol N-acetylglucosamine transferase
MNASTYRVLLAAGGTGGHLFPADALARELLRRGSRVELATDARAFAKASGGLSDGLSDVVVHRIAAGGIAGKGIFRRLMNAGRMGWGFLQSLWLILKTRPDCVVGFGGYASVPTLLAAQCLGRPTLLHEQNAVMGRANRFLMPRARVVALGFEATRHAENLPGAKQRVVGNPVRPMIASLSRSVYVPPKDEDAIDIFVMGGSQGARAFASLIPEAIGALSDRVRSHVRLAQQCRAEDMERTGAIYRRLGLKVELRPFFDDVPARLGAAHLVIARAGASTVSELTAAGRPAILIPLPSAIDDHQEANARAFEQSGAGWVIAEKDGAAPLQALLQRLLATPESLAEAARRARALGRPDAAFALADAVMAMLPGGPVRDSLEILA